MLSMGSSTADGMKRNTNSTFSITSGATAAGAPSNYNGSKWSVGGSSGYGYCDSTRSFTGIPFEEQPTTKPVKREVEGVRSITSAACGASAADPTGFYGTRLTTGSVHQMGAKSAQASAEGLGRSIMQGADASGKPVYSGMTFSTAGSHKRDDSINASTMSATMGATSRGRSGQPTTRRPRDPHQASQGEHNRSMSPSSTRHRSMSPSQRVTFGSGGGDGDGYDNSNYGEDTSRYDYRGRRDYHMDTADLLAGRPISSAHGRSRSPNAHLAKGSTLPTQHHGRRTSPDAQRRGGGGGRASSPSGSSHADESYGGGGGGDYGLTSNSSLRTAGDHTSAGQAAIDRALARAQQAAQVLAASRTSASEADPMPRAERRLLREREAAASRGEFYLNDSAPRPLSDHHTTTTTTSGYDDVEATGAETRLRLIQNTSARGSAPLPPKHISSASSVDSSTVMSTATYPDPPPQQQQQQPRKSKWATDERGQWVPSSTSGIENNTEASNVGNGGYLNDDNYADQDDNLSTTSSTFRKPPPPAAWTGGAPASTGALAEEVAKRAMGIQQRRNSGHGAGPTGYSAPAREPAAATTTMSSSSARSQSSRYQDPTTAPPSAARASLSSRAQEGTPASPPPTRARRAVVEKLLSAEAAAASGAVAENRMRRQQAKLNRLQARADQVPMGMIVTASKFTPLAFHTTQLLLSLTLS